MVNGSDMFRSHLSHTLAIAQSNLAGRQSFQYKERLCISRVRRSRACTYIREFENATTARVSCSHPVVQVDRCWKMGERDERMLFVGDMVGWLNGRPVVEADGGATSLMRDFGGL